MNIKEIRKALKNVDPSCGIYFDFCRCIPTKANSWRGSYDEPAIGWSENFGEESTVGKFLEQLDELTSGKIYYGWKGGEFTYNEHHTLHIDNAGQSTETEISAITEKYGIVTIHTIKEVW